MWRRAIIMILFASLFFFMWSLLVMNQTPTMLQPQPRCHYDNNHGNHDNNHLTGYQFMNERLMMSATNHGLNELLSP